MSTQTTTTLQCYTKCSLDGEREELLPSSLEGVGGSSLLMLSLSSLAPSLPIEMESEKMREEVKELIGAMWIE